MRTSFTMLLLGCGFASVLATLATAQTSGVVFVGDMQSVDRAVLEAAELPLPSVSGKAGLQPPRGMKSPLVDGQVRPASLAQPSAPTRVVPTGFNGTLAPRSTGTQAAAPKTSFLGRMKPAWLFGKSDTKKSTPKDPFATASQQARIELANGAASARSGVKLIPAYANTQAVTPTGYERRVAANSKPSKPNSQRGNGIVQRSAPVQRRGILSGLFKSDDSKGAPAGSTPAMMQARGPKNGFATVASSKASPRASAAQPTATPQAIRVASQTKPMVEPASLARTAGSKPGAPKPRAFAPRPIGAKPRAKSAKVMAIGPSFPRVDEPAGAAVFASDESQEIVARVEESDAEVPFSASTAIASDTLAETPQAPMPPKMTPAFVEATAAHPAPAKPIVVAAEAKAIALPKATTAAPYPSTGNRTEAYASDDSTADGETLPVSPAVEINDEAYFATDRFERIDTAPKEQSAEPTQRSIDLLAEAHQIAAYAGTADEFSSVVKHCRYVMAIDESQQAQAYANQLAGWALTKRGDCFDDGGRHDDAEIDYREALRCDAECWRAEHALGVLASRKGKVAEAQRHFDRTLDLNPEFAKAYSNRAALAVHRGDYHRALEDFQQAIDIDPDLSAAHAGRGRVCHMLGMLDEGLRHLDAAEILDPENASIASGRADLLVDLGRYGQATEAYDRAIRLNPSSPAPYRNLAWMQATCPIASVRDGKAALTNAERAQQLSDRTDDLTLDTKAAALASLGRFDEASDVQRQAIEIAPPADAAAYSERLVMYEQGEAFTTQPVAVRQASYHSTSGTH